MAVDNWGEAVVASNALKVLVFDIETAPLLAYVWSCRDDYIPPDRLQHETFMIAWAAKWWNSKGMFSDVLTSDEAVDQDDARIVAGLADLVREADIIIAHNVNGFDLPVLNGRVLQLGLEPLGPVRTLDTLKLAQKSFRLSSNKLDHLGTVLGMGNKIHTNFDLWRRCYMGDEKALAEMSRYNRRDVTLLEDVFDAIRPYVSNLPRLFDGRDGDFSCPFCGSEDLTRRGTYRTQASNYQRYQCNNCARYSRDRTLDPSRKNAVHPL